MRVMPKKAHRDYVDYEVAFPVTVTFNPQEPFVWVQMEGLKKFNMAKVLQWDTKHAARGAPSVEGDDIAACFLD